jgi:SNF2 family DNA or RNA helicase
VHSQSTAKSCFCLLLQLAQVTATLEHIYSADGMRGPFLIVVPLSTLEHWRREIEAWTDMQLCVYHDIGGGKDMRDVIREYEWYYKVIYCTTTTATSIGTAYIYATLVRAATFTVAGAS